MNQGYNPYQPQQGPPLGAPPDQAPPNPGSYNPYAPPSADAQVGSPGAAVGGQGQATRMGDAIIVAREGGVLPDRCVKCNAPTSFKMLRKMYWHPVWVYFLILVSVWIYIIVALIMRKKAEVHVGVCDEHQRQRKNAIMMGWIGALAGIGSCSVGVSLGDNDVGPLLAIVGVGALLVFAIIGLVRARLCHPVKMDDHYVHLKVGKPFLDSFPPSYGP